MTQELDRLARALHEAGGFASGDIPFEEMIGVRRDQVRAVLTHLRDEPSEGAVEAGVDAMDAYLRTINPPNAFEYDDWLDAPKDQIAEMKAMIKSMQQSWANHILTEGGQ